MCAMRHIDFLLLLWICTINEPLDTSEIPETKNDVKIAPKSLSNIIELINIESTDCSHRNLLSKESNKLFFAETSGKQYLTPRYACAIESAVKNTDLSGHIIVVMTSPILDININNEVKYAKKDTKIIPTIY